MKPVVNSIYFKLSLASFAGYFGHLFATHLYVMRLIEAGSPTGPLFTLLFCSGPLWVGVGAMLWYASSHPHASVARHIGVLLLVPLALLPLLLFLQAIVAILPIYSMAGDSFQ